MADTACHVVASATQVGLIQVLALIDMIRSILLSTGGVLAFALAMALFTRTRAREIDSNGNPVLRYLAAPYMMLGCATTFLAFGVYQWLDPFNHRYSGNLLILSYIPAAVGVFALGTAIYFFTYRATLRETVIEVSRWPFGTTSLNLSDVETVESKGQNTIVRFSGDKKFVVYCTYSGRAHFLSVLSANNSFKADASAAA